VHADDIQILEYRIGGAGVPGGLDALLGGQQFDEFTELAAHKTPAALNMADQRMGLILSQDGDAPYAGIDAVGQGKVYDPELASERHSRLGTPQCQVS
jgi:hypothetical protein